MRQILLFIACLFCSNLFAQKLTVESMTLAGNDISASQYRKNDFNNQPCALMKVQLATRGATFAGSVVGTPEFKNGVYWVYMPAGAKELEVQHNSFIPCHVNFGDYGITKLQALTTYVLTLLMPQTGNVNVDDGMRYLAMTVEPANASVYIDNQPQVLQNGSLSMLLSMGQHQYRVESPAYETKTGTFTIGDETLQLPVKLESVMASLSVSTATPGTQIYVNDQLRGTSSWTGSLSAGTYRVEGRLQGYRNHRQNITLAQRDRQQITIPALQAITGNLNVNYQPLNAEAYLDGQLLGKSPNVFRNVMVGSHNIELRASGYTSKQERITIEEGRTAMLSGSLERQVTTQTQSPDSVQATPSPSQSAAVSNGGPIETIIVKGVSFNMVRVDGGTFQMGATSEQQNPNSNEKPMHQVTLSTYYIGETEVTQALWKAVMGTTVRQQRDKANKSWPLGGEGRNLPMYYISWNECQDFIRKLNQLTGKNFRLPTEAEWEYAARGGNKSRGYQYSGSNNIDDVAWYTKTTNGTGTRNVKTKQANELELYDMSGNVWEWCQDWKGDYPSFAQTNSTGPSTGSSRVLRGGGWINIASDCRVANRLFDTPGHRGYNLGLRLALQ